jgi:hypothetical protein
MRDFNWSFAFLLSLLQSRPVRCVKSAGSLCSFDVRALLWLRIEHEIIPEFVLAENYILTVTK